jgi:hypothetical protein
MGSAAIGGVLADYLDAGGRVIESTFVHDYYGWELSGDYMTGGYSPFTDSTTDLTGVETMVLVDGTHPVMAGVTSMTTCDGTTLMINPGLAAGATLLATWTPSGYNGIAVNADETVIGLNILIFNETTGIWTGHLPQLLYNSITWLCDN